MSKYKLAATLSITPNEAQALIDEYFRKFPGIGKMLRFLGSFGVRFGFIQTLAPFHRKRWFPYWKFARADIQSHLTGSQYNPTLGSIERASKNMPVQGSSADMTKLAVWLMFETIHGGELEPYVKLVMQVHDQITARVEQSHAEQWKTLQHACMLEAAKFVIKDGSLGAETNITPVWTK